MIDLNEGYFTHTNEFVTLTGEIVTDPFYLVLLLSDQDKAKPYLEWYTNGSLGDHTEQRVKMIHLNNPDHVIKTILGELLGEEFDNFWYIDDDGDEVVISFVGEAAAYRLA